jgi:hypothetical protein
MEEHADHGYTETKHTLRGRLVQPANMLGLIAAQLQCCKSTSRWEYLLRPPTFDGQLRRSSNISVSRELPRQWYITILCPSNISSAVSGL